MSGTGSSTSSRPIHNDDEPSQQLLLPTAKLFIQLVAKMLISYLIFTALSHHNGMKPQIFA